MAGAFEMAMDRPITGIGPGQFGEESVNYVLDDPIVLADPQAHDAYLELLAESGAFALAAFLFFLGIPRRSHESASQPTAAEGTSGWRPRSKHRFWSPSSEQYSSANKSQARSG